MNDALDDIMDESGDEEEQDAIVTQVLDEIGIEISGKVSEHICRLCSSCPNLSLKLTVHVMNNFQHLHHWCPIAVVSLGLFSAGGCPVSSPWSARGS